jgi:hypothetical protein
MVRPIMTASRLFRSPIMGEVAEAASVSYAPALSELIGCEFVPDKPRVRGGIFLTFRDERGALVKIRLLRKAAGNLLRALESGPVANIRGNPLVTDLIEVQPLVEVTSAHDRVEPESRDITPDSCLA